MKIKYFNPSEMRKNPVILVIGKRGSGKSTVAETICSYFAHIEEGLCISPTDHFSGFWARHIPPLYIHGEYNPGITKRLLDHQYNKWKKYKQKCKKRGKKPKPGKISPAFAIYDDVSFDKSFFRDLMTRKLLMNGRHFAMTIVITVQYLMDITADLRNQIDYVVVMKETSRNNREKLHHYFAGMFPSLVSFEKTLMKCTEDRECMVIDNTAGSYNPEDCVYFYRATPNKRFRMGSRLFWKHSKTNYDSDAEGEYEGNSRGVSERDKKKLDGFRVEKEYPVYKKDKSKKYASVYRGGSKPKTILKRKQKQKK